MGTEHLKFISAIFFSFTIFIVGVSISSDIFKKISSKIKKYIISEAIFDKNLRL